MARALRSFRDGDDSDWDWAGAIIVGEFLDDVQVLRKFTESYAKALSKKKTGKR